MYMLLIFSPMRCRRFCKSGLDSDAGTHWDPPMENNTEKDPFPVEALPTCDYALDVCRKDSNPKCMQHYRDFKSNCRVSDGNCKMEDW